MRPPAAMLQNRDLGPLIAQFAARVNSLAMPAGTRLTSWWRGPAANASAGGAELSQHLVGLAADFVSSRPLELVALAQRAGLSAIYHNVGSGWHVHIQAGRAGYLERLIVGRPWLARMIGVGRSLPPPYVIPHSDRSTSA